MIELLLRNGADPAADDERRRHAGRARAALWPRRGRRRCLKQSRGAPPPAACRDSEARGAGHHRQQLVFPRKSARFAGALACLGAVLYNRSVPWKFISPPLRRAGNQPRHPAREVRQGRRSTASPRCAAAWRAPSPQVERRGRARPVGARASCRRRSDGFIPAGRINSAAGIDLQATLINCFVQPVGDSISEVVDGRPGIYTALHGSRRDHAPRRRRRLRLLRHPARRAPRSRARARARAARCPTCASSTAPARRWSPPARAAARRWACCAATTRTSRTSSTPRTRATSPTSTSRSA